ncbi:cobalamin biosynthesis protein CbiX [Roseateles sp. DAIF2]|uniref:sirohydrochlorin chelatase n=1 Tax=Roseateles sp. DAIF2 TaxID=2714952 RepID=UPI0018A32E2A|nr:CbiX/SirB N-terminal domain-containing protein [Roseateles sp. DAIF2]QPF73487.1 cobalamin biosynthesis protein CbiX [Roseateles sp. DAIF2]
MDGLLLFAHGARDPAWARPFEAIAARIRAARPALPLALAYLELMQPDIESAAAQLVEAGCSRIHIVPMFLGASGHVRRDVPPLVERLRARHGLEWQLHPAIGEQAAVIQAMADTSLQFLSMPHA